MASPRQAVQRLPWQITLYLRVRSSSQAVHSLPWWITLCLRVISPRQAVPRLPWWTTLCLRVTSPRQAVPSLPQWTALLPRQRVWSLPRQSGAQQGLGPLKPAIPRQVIPSASQAVPLGWTVLSLSQTVMFPR